jgi:hypothetical protein
VIVDSRSFPPAILTNERVRELNKVVMGQNSRSRNLKVDAYQKASLSGCLIANAFGAASPRINRIIVPNAVAAMVVIANPNLSSSKVVATTVTTDANATLTKLFPNKIVDNNRSGSCIILATFLAPDLFMLTRCAIRPLSNDKNAASELEKNADKSTKTPIRINLKDSPSSIVKPPFGLKAF